MTLQTNLSSPAAQGGTSGATSLVARYRSSLLIGLALALAVVVAVALGTGARTATPMDPDNPGPGGTRALAQVLGDNGVDVEIARTADDLEELTVDEGTTVVVVLPEYLGRSTARRLLDHAGNGGLLVVVGAGPGVAELLGVDGPSQVAVGDGREANCADPLFDGLRIEVDSAAAYPQGECFRGESGGLVAHVREDLVLLGADQALTNDQVLRADNAAVGLRLLGQRERLVWYVPTLNDLLADDGVSLQSLLPRWIVPGLWILALSMAAVIWWRARRLGALASEPLPVVVRAVETTRSLGRLYRKSGDRGHAAAALRQAARARCAERLRLGSRVTPETLVGAVARRTGRAPADVASLLDPHAPVPATDRDLITLATDLAELDREVRRS